MRASVFLSCWLLAGVAAADDGEAERLFTEAQKLRAAGRYELACSKLEQSLKADWALGAQLYLADCYERTGRLASAYETFRQGHIDAVSAGDRERAELARNAMGAIEPRLAKLHVVVAHAAESAELTLDGVPVPRGDWNSVAVDPGEHILTLNVPGESPIVQRVRAPAEGRKARIELRAPSAPRPTPPRAAPGESPPGAETAPGLEHTHIAAIAFGALAVAGAAVGTGLLVHAKSTYDASAEFCTADDFCAEQGLEARSEARQLATGATVAYAGAGAAAAASIVLLVVGATDAENTVGIAPGPGAFGASVKARW